MKWLDRSLVTSPYCLGLCTEESEFRKQLKKLNVPGYKDIVFVSQGAGATIHEFQSSDGKLCLIVAFPVGKASKEQRTALMVHEAVHAWQAIRKELGEKYPSSEFEAYAVQHLVQELLRADKKLRKVSK